MPELPEVEIIRKRLLPLIKGKVIRRVKVIDDRTLEGDRRILTKRRITNIRRAGKLLLFELDNKTKMAIHLRMTGQLIYQTNNNKLTGGGHEDSAYSNNLPHNHTRVIFEFTDYSRLFFNDLRKFARISVWREGAEHEGEKTIFRARVKKFIKLLGPDALASDICKALRQSIKARPRTAIKSLLLNQQVIAGVGNIYADEALSCAKIMPERKAGQIKTAEITRLAKCTKLILKKAIKFGGSSRQAFRQPDGSKGSYLDHALVYAREGQPCRRCGKEIVRKKISGRSAHFCPICQK